MKIVAIIQARLTSTRFPRKVLEKVGGKTMIARVCQAARDAGYVNKVVVAWAQNFPHLDENNVLGRFREIAMRENPNIIVRVTSDCPLITGWHIDEAVHQFLNQPEPYLLVGQDGFDVQVFLQSVLWDPEMVDSEHVIKPTPDRNTPKYLSVDTPEDLERVRTWLAEGHTYRDTRMYEAPEIAYA